MHVYLQELISIVSTQPNRGEVSAALSHRLSHRPQVRGFNEPQEESQFFLNSIRLSSRISSRASKEELIRSNIMHSGDQSSRLAVASAKLDKERRVNQLNMLLKQRKQAEAEANETENK
jgi:hypothetical protein